MDGWQRVRNATQDKTRVYVLKETDSEQRAVEQDRQ